MKKIFSNKLYVIITIVAVLILLHVEFIINQKSAPENILVQVKTPENLPDENAECFADIIYDVGEERKPLIGLKTIYDFIQARTFSVSEDKGFYLLETGLENYNEEYEIRIVCRSQDLKGVSYTIINNTNSADCEVRNDGQLLLCTQ